jgi:predicted nuclease of predicted toxin-antitoxin system
MKILVDAGVGRAVTQALEELGHDVSDAAIRFPRIEDISLLDTANAEERLVITMDKDFGELAFLAGLPHAGILLLRMDDASGAEKAEAVKAIFQKHGDKLAGAFAVYHKKRLRIRRPR